MKYLVCRMDGVRPHNQISSSLFPIVVDGRDCITTEDIVRKACGTINQGYVGMYDYLVVPLIDAQVVGFKPRQQYEVTVTPYNRG